METAHLRHGFSSLARCSARSISPVVAFSRLLDKGPDDHHALVTSGDVQRLVIKRTCVLQPTPGMEATRGQSQEPQEWPQNATKSEAASTARRIRLCRVRRADARASSAIELASRAGQP